MELRKIEKTIKINNIIPNFNGSIKICYILLLPKIN